VSYAKKNVRDVDDQAVGHALIKPGRREAFAHLEVLIFGPHVESDAELVENFWGS
jgi:hypothetical protein